MKKYLPIAIVAIVIILGLIFVPKLVHSCDDCGKTFVGTGYEPTALVDMFGDEEAEDMVICEECAEEHHALEMAFGAELEDFKRDF